MKTLKYFLIIGFAAQLLNAQSNITFSGNASIDVGLGADICADVISGTVTGDGTKCGSPLLKVLNLTALIEGFYNGVTMVPDTVTVQFRNTGSPYALVEQKKIVLSSTGAGTGSLTSVLNGASYYLVVKHRNSIETWSKTGKSFTSNLLDYDFTTAAAQAYGDNLVLKGSKYCMWSGDIDQNGAVDALDRSQCWNDRNLLGYLPSDVDGNGSVDALDRSICWNNRNNIKRWPGEPPFMKPIQINEIKNDD